MDNNKKEESSDGVMKEDPETVLRVAKNIIEPALQEALKKARDEATNAEILSALANSYGGLLVDLMGFGPVANLMRGHADHIASREESTLNVSNH
jgi:hypothetical protein